MLQRCNNPRSRQFNDYGGRGISVCRRWRKFANFIADMGLPKPGDTLERENNNGNYSKANCVWASRTVQNNNTRRNVKFRYNGISRSLKEWSEVTGIKFATLVSRLYLYGWSTKQAFTTEVGRTA